MELNKLKELKELLSEYIIFAISNNCYSYTNEIIRIMRLLDSDIAEIEANKERSE